MIHTGAVYHTEKKAIGMTTTVDDSVVYILSTADGRASYCGVTNDLGRRLRQHNGLQSGGARYTRSRRHWYPLWVVCGFTSRSQTGEELW